MVIFFIKQKQCCLVADATTYLLRRKKNHLKVMNERTAGVITT